MVQGDNAFSDSVNQDVNADNLTSQYKHLIVGDNAFSDSVNQGVNADNLTSQLVHVYKLLILHVLLCGILMS